MDRFSPNFTDWRARGFTNVAPMPAYGHVFPFGPDDLAEIAYYFRYAHPQLERAQQAGAEMDRFVAEWLQRRQHGETGVLAVERHGDGLVLHDTRFTHEASSIRFDRSASAVLMACDWPASRATALGRAARSRQTEADVDRALSALLARGAVVQAGNLLVTVACLPQPVRDSRRT